MSALLLQEGAAAGDIQSPGTTPVWRLKSGEAPTILVQAPRSESTPHPPTILCPVLSCRDTGHPPGVLPGLTPCSSTWSYFWFSGFPSLSLSQSRSGPWVSGLCFWHGSLE